MQSLFFQLVTSPWVGWVATALFAVSYFVRREYDLLRLQTLSACLWITYGLAIGAMPVVTANVVVAGGASFKAFRLWRARHT